MASLKIAFMITLISLICLRADAENLLDLDAFVDDSPLESEIEDSSSLITPSASPIPQSSISAPPTESILAPSPSNEGSAPTPSLTSTAESSISDTPNSAPAPEAEAEIKISLRKAESPGESDDAAVSPSLAPSSASSPSPRSSSSSKDIPLGINISTGIKKLCESTDYRDLCLSSLEKYTGKPDALSVLDGAIKATIEQVKLALETTNELAAAPNNGASKAAAINDCKSMYNDALDNLQNAQQSISTKDTSLANSMLSAVITDSVSCSDGFKAKSPLASIDEKLQHMASNCLALAALIKT